MYKYCLACHYKVYTDEPYLGTIHKRTTYYCYFLVLLFMGYFQV